MKIFELYRELEKRIPSELSCEWDSDGLECCPSPEREVGRVLISLDVTDEVIEKAKNEKFDVIIAHHPLFFKGLDDISATSPNGKRAVELIRSDIAVMTFHTRLDALDGGVNDTLAARLGLKSVEKCGDEGIMRVGELAEDMTDTEFAAFVKQKLSAKQVICSSAGNKVKRVALLGGSGGDDIILAKSVGADSYLTGELKYHELLSANEVGVNLFCAGHFYTEYPVCDVILKTVSEICPEAYAEVCFSDRISVI